jgi:sulfur-carrier protein adenylyltransferase/sulfurtransferase
MIEISLPKRIAEVSGLTQTAFAVTGATVGNALDALCAEHPDLSSHLVNGAGRLKDIFHVFVDEESGDETTPIQSGQTITLLIAQMGGSPDEGLSTEEVRRYARQITLPGVGRAGQARLKAASVLAIGAGGLGSPSLLYLAAAGVGQITIVEFDKVDESNLQRQVIHSSQAIGLSKAQSARARMRDLNPHIDVEIVEARLDDYNVDALVSVHDVVLDGSDNFRTRDILNAATIRHGRPLVFGAVYQFEGQVSVFNARPGAPCYRCLFKSMPSGDLAPNCAAGGVIGVVPGITGLHQANEVIKIILGIGQPLIGRLLTIDCLTGASRTLSYKAAPGCPACRGEKVPAETEPVSRQWPQSIDTISPQALADALNGSNAPIVIDVRELGELEITRFDGALHMPLARLEREASTISREASYVVICRSGARSEQGARILLGLDFQHVASLKGGLAAWADIIDPALVVV